MPDAPKEGGVLAGRSAGAQHILSLEQIASSMTVPEH
jgi:hypothetical protein